MSNHRLAIATHNRLAEFRRLLSHVRSYDQIFANILIVVDGDFDYYEKIQKVVSDFCSGSSNYELFHSNQVGGAAVRNHMISTSVERNYELLSFLDDDDIPYKHKFVKAEQVLSSRNNCIGYATGYYRYYGGFGRRITSRDRKIGLEECLRNNDIGGFSFVTLNLKMLAESIIIPIELKSNQDWFLWLAILRKHAGSYFWKEGSSIGLVYSDIRKGQDRLTLNSSNLSSTIVFYEILKAEHGLDLDSAIDYFYYKYLRQKNLLSVVIGMTRNRDIYGLSAKHWRSLYFNAIYNGFKRLFLSKTPVSNIESNG